MSDETMIHEINAQAIRWALGELQAITDPTPGATLDAAVVCQSAARRYLEILERLPRLPPNLYRQLSAMRDAMPFGADRDAVTDVLTLLKLLEVDYA